MEREIERVDGGGGGREDLMDLIEILHSGTQI